MIAVVVLVVVVVVVLVVVVVVVVVDSSAFVPLLVRTSKVYNNLLFIVFLPF